MAYALGSGAGSRAATIDEAIQRACAQVGIEPPEHWCYDKWIPCNTGSRNGKGDGRIKVSRDCVHAHNWQTYAQATVFVGPQSPSKAARSQAEAERQRSREHAAGIASKVWRQSKPASADHPYLRRKGVAPVPALREIVASDLANIIGYIPHSSGEQLEGRILVAPVKVDGKLSTLEFIDEDGRKAALKDGRKGGGYWATQPIPEEGPVALAEGIATALSIREATGLPVVAALSAGNLLAAGEAIRAKYPQVELILCTDLDRRTGEPFHSAVEAARHLKCRLAIPDFGEDRREEDTDFNDLAAKCGLEAVRRAIANAAEPPRGEHQPDPKNAPAGEDAWEVRLIRASDIDSEPITWLWDGWLASGKVHMLAGAAGTGKTTIALALAATVTAGGRWPDGTWAAAGNVIIWSGEDDPADTLKPRLELLGADLSRVYFVGDVGKGDKRRAFDPAYDIEALRRKLVEVGGAKLVIVDPIVSAVAGDSHKNAEVRRGLQPLADLARDMRCAVLGITHFSKGTGGRDPVERLTGSLAFGALPRIVLVTAKYEDEEGRTVRLLCRAKSNLGPDGDGFEYAVQPAELRPGIMASTVLWGKAVSGTARELLAQIEEDRKESRDAADWLRDVLIDGPKPACEVRRLGNEAGFSWRTLQRAARRLKVTTRRSGFGKGSIWCLETPIRATPPSFAPFAPTFESGANGTNGANEQDVIEVEI